MNAKSVPLPTSEDLVTERLLGAVESAIGVIQERLANLAADSQDAQWSVSDLVRLLQLRNQLQGERPCTIFARWVDDPNDVRSDIGSGVADNNRNNGHHPDPDTRGETRIDASDLPRNHRNKGARK